MEFILGIVILVLDIWAIVSVLGSGASVPQKLLWTLGIIVFPVIGFIVWYLAGPRGRAAIA
jgi:hypothetical protein